MNKISPLGLFWENSEKYADRPAIYINDKYYSYAEFSEIVNSIRKVLKGYSGRSKNIGLVTDNNVQTYAAILAILSTGMAYVPLNKKNPVDRNLDIISEAGIELVLTGSDDTIYQECQTINLLELHGNDSNDDNFIESKDNDLAYIFFTSGSTGKPKGVPVSHKNLNAFLFAILRKMDYSFNEEDHFLQMFELTFDLSVFSIFVPLCVGACFHVPSSYGMTFLNVLKTLENNKITVALMVPSVINYLGPYFSEINLPDLKYSLFCGEALDAKLTFNWEKCVPNAVIENVYGPTEATIFCLAYRLKKGEYDPEAVNGIVSIGKDMPGMETFVVDQDYKIIEKGEKGELCLVGEQVVNEYWNNPQKTQQAFIDIKVGDALVRGYRTGDLVYMNANGNYNFCGRIDNQVKINGFRVELEEIEFYAKQFTSLDNVIALINTDSFGNTQLLLYLENYVSDIFALNEFLKEKLPVYMIPYRYINVPQIPRNLNGKVDRNKLKNIS